MERYLASHVSDVWRWELAGVVRFLIQILRLVRPLKDSPTVCVPYDCVSMLTHFYDVLLNREVRQRYIFYLLVKSRFRAPPINSDFQVLMEF